MVLENSSNNKSHHHHHHRNSMKEFRGVYAAEEPIQVFESDMRRTKSEKMGTREVVKEEDVDKEAEEFIKFEHRKFSKWMTKSV
ncbi:unnamed protein product [Arabis nemorensis]|uniref:Uncharacterized protein n=1 Tax=Arabis nemorensis TaxID=586526 RepID=A0A565AWM8_9BRAS|nr:unnamed protein product [Arabis nemorensis]